MPALPPTSRAVDKGIRPHRLLRQTWIFETYWGGLLLSRGAFALLRITKRSRAVLPMPLHVIFFRQWRNACRISAQLAHALQHDLGPSVIAFDFSLDLDLPPLELLHVADLLEVTRKHNDREWTGSVVCAEIEEVDAAFAAFHVQNFPRYTAVGADVLACFHERNAGGSCNGRRRSCKNNEQERENAAKPDKPPLPL